MTRQFNEPRIPCEIDDCSGDFARLADMQRHVKEVHGGLRHCTQPGCSWRGAKRKGRLDAHLLKAHPESHKEVDLNVPDDFGSGSETSPQISTQVAQTTEDTAIGGDYAVLDDGTNHQRTSAFQTASSFPLEQNDLILRPEAPSEGSTIFAAPWSPTPQPQQPFQQGYTEYPVYPAVPVAGYPANVHPPQVFPYTGNQFNAAVGNNNPSDSHRQGSRGGSNGNHRGHYS